MMRATIRPLGVALALLAAACGGETGEEPAMEMAASERAEAGGEAAAVSLADVAGTWDVVAISEAGDTVTHQMVATDTRQGWEMRTADREPIPMEVVAVEGDSIVTRTAPYPSLLRDGVDVTVTSVTRLSGDRMVGTWVARYETTGADSVLRGRLEGSRAGG